MKKVNLDRKDRRRKKISTQINGEKARPRISVFRSNKYMYSQAIDDENRTTVASYSSMQIKSKKEKINKTAEARLIGVELGKVLKEMKIKKAVFDRNVYAYKGRVKELCEGLREAGIQI